MIKSALAAFILLALKNIRKGDITYYSIILSSVLGLRTLLESYLVTLEIILPSTLNTGIHPESYFIFSHIADAQSSIALAFLPLMFGIVHVRVEKGLERKPLKSCNVYEVVDYDREGKRVAAYRRVSTLKQVNQGFSLEVQQETLQKMVDVNKPSKVYWFADEGKTGTTFANRKIGDIIELAKKREIDELWVCYIDRLGRKTHDLLDLYNRLTALEVSIRTPEQVYTPNDLPSLLLAMLAFYGAEDDNRKRSTRVQDSKRRRFREKNWNKPSIPLGYAFDGGWLRKMPEWETMIQDAYALFIEQHNLAEVVRSINKMYSGLLRKPLETFRLRRILCDPVYIGKPEHVGKIVDDPSLRFIDPEMFEDAKMHLVEIEEKYKRSGIGPFEKYIMEDGFNSEIFKDIQLHHICGGRLVKNGTVLTGGLEQQIYICGNCSKQLKLPRSKHPVKGVEMNPLKTKYVSNLGSSLARDRLPKSKRRPREVKDQANLLRFYSND